MSRSSMAIEADHARWFPTSLHRRVMTTSIPSRACIFSVINRQRSCHRASDAPPADHLPPSQPGQRRQRYEEERAEREERLVEAGGGGGALDQRLDEFPGRRVDRPERQVVKALERQADETRRPHVA